uniref:Uncharacterized protein n=1 Tax=Rhodnius prolixus TaxID=13249 RepID=T1ICC0_RHOPR
MKEKTKLQLLHVEDMTMMSKLASFLNDVNTRSAGIGKLSDLRTGYSYEVKQFERINTKFGDAIFAHLHYIGPTMDYPTRIFLPR